jgi:hypothetical protein
MYRVGSMSEKRVRKYKPTANTAKNGRYNAVAAS